MKFLKWMISLILAIYIYYFYNLFILDHLKPQGIPLRTWYLDGKEISFPFGERVDGPVERVFKTSFHSDEAALKFIVIQAPLVHGLELKFNGRVVLERDRMEAFNLWPTTLIASLNIEKGINTLEMRIKALYSYRITYPPFLTDDTSAVRFGMFVFVGLPTMTMGVLLTVGVILIMLSLKISIPFLNAYGVFSLAFLMRAFWMTNFLPLAMSEFAFIVWKKLIFSLTHWVRAFLNLGVEMEFGKRRTSIWVLVVVSLYTVFAFLSQDVDSVRTIGFHLSRFILIIMIYDAVLLIIKKEPWLFSAFFLSIMSYIGTLFRPEFLPYHPSFVSVESIYFSVVFAIILLKEFDIMRKRLYDERLKSMTDPLTGIYNRRILDLLELKRTDSIVFFDIDDFKEINDKFGHEYGDAILKDFSDILKKNLRSDDTPIRYGGDEFVAVLKNCDEAKAKNIVQRIREEFKKIRGLDVSYGIVQFTGSLKNVLQTADELMYKMKKMKRSK